jgi:hypothetical protein
MRLKLTNCRLAGFNSDLTARTEEVAILMPKFGYAELFNFKLIKNNSLRHLFFLVEEIIADSGKELPAKLPQILP